MKLLKFVRALHKSGALKDLREGIEEGLTEDSDGGVEFTLREGIALALELVNTLDEAGEITLSDKHVGWLEDLGAVLPIGVDIVRDIREASKDGKVDTVDVLELQAKYTGPLIEAAGVVAA